MFYILLQTYYPNSEFIEIKGNIKIECNLVTLYPETGSSMIYQLDKVAFIKISHKEKRGV